jgi:hypothetical protein
MTKLPHKISKNTEISLEEIADVTGKTKQWINRLAADGYFKSERHGVYRIGNVWLGMLKKAAEEKKSALSPAHAKLIEARTKQIDIRNAKDAGELISFKLSTEIKDEICGSIIAMLNGLPSRLLQAMPAAQRDPALRAAFEGMINDERRRLNTHWEKLAEQAEQSEVAADAEEIDE